MSDYSDQELQAAAQRVANVYARVVNRKLGCRIPLPVPMTFNLELESMEMARAAGRASSSMRMDINMTIFRDNVQEVLNEVIPHEMGHLVQFDKFDLKGSHTPGHGVHWQEAMRVMGKEPKKTHSMDVSKAIAAYKAHQKQKKANDKAAAKIVKSILKGI